MTKLVNSELLRIRKLANEATPGPWRFDAGNHNVEWVQDRMQEIFYGSSMGATFQDDCNLEYVAELSPEVVKSLIDEVIAWRTNIRPG